MKLLATMVARNEAGRYLDACLKWLKTCVDEVHVFDDQSDDETPEIVLSHGCRLTVRGDDQPSFLDHEGKFRQAAWDAFEQKIKPQKYDWVLAIDADEFLIAGGKERLELVEAAANAEFRGAKSVILNFQEIFGFVDNIPLVRTDGYWASIAHPRFFQYRPNGQFLDRAMACGSEPTYVKEAPSSEAPGLTILHFGYAKEEDQASKYARYSQTTGHNSRHIDSILERGRLEKWRGKVPCLT